MTAGAKMPWLRFWRFYAFFLSISQFILRYELTLLFDIQLPRHAATCRDDFAISGVQVNLLI